MDDGLLVCMLHPCTDLDEKLHTLPHREAMAIAVLADGQPVEILHDKVGPAFRSGAGIESLGDRGAVMRGRSG